MYTLVLMAKSQYLLVPAGDLRAPVANRPLNRTCSQPIKGDGPLPTPHLCQPQYWEEEPSYR